MQTDHQIHRHLTTVETDTNVKHGGQLTTTTTFEREGEGT
jgi:hypothetical protein